jgi:phosphoglycolate phosphatase
MLQIPFKTIVFDLDGTIVDTAPDLAAALNTALISLARKPLALSAVRSMIGHGTLALLTKGLEATGGVDQDVIDAGHPVLMRFYEAHICDMTKPFPSIKAAFDDLSALGIALAICTNKPASLTNQLIEALGWQHRFAAIVAGDTLAVSKPDPAPLHLAIERAGGGPAAFVGDSIVDVETAKAAGVRCIAVSFGFADRPVHALGADAVIDSFSELMPALADLSSAPNGVSRDGQQE